MSRHLIVLSAVLVAGSVLGCERSKLQREMLEDSTWETSSGDESWEVADDPPRTDDEWEEKNAPMDGAEPDPPEAEEQPQPESSLYETYPRVRRGVIARADLLPVLDQGLGRFLQNVETQPTFHKGAFVGFRIVSLFPGEPAYASLDLRPGDTVTRINGKRIERPEQAVAVWEELRSASSLVVEYERGGEPLDLRFSIVDEG